ncbi:protein KTI12 homolog [Brevipalpus obovatus]|uniref:protein KTI12 homolog n=1 Tax=Brevipalpus obovatus TaxID=246614 RepID=UPI003D9F66B4
MPLIVMVGPPCSGKSFWAHKIADFLRQKNQNVIIVSEHDFVKDVNETFSNSAREKELRAQLKSSAQRNLNKHTVVLIDSGNYIKGFRYELFCVAKEQASTYCVIECSIPKKEALIKNKEKKDGHQYNEQTFEALHFRYEAPNSNNRWDHPLFLMASQSQSTLEDIYESLFINKPLKPNKATLPPSRTDTNFLFQLETQTKEIVDHLSRAMKIGASLSMINVPGVSVSFGGNQNLTPADLNRIRRSFITYTKMHPIKNSDDIKETFMQYLNSSTN